jgi:hypothetical protein
MKSKQFTLAINQNNIRIINVLIYRIRHAKSWVALAFGGSLNNILSPFLGSFDPEKLKE